MNNSNTWTEVIDSKSSIFKINIKQIFEYKDLMLMFVKRDFAATYKQTILGPLWFFIQPILTTLMFTLVFGKFANLKTDVEPKFLFYFSGVVIWNYFQDCFLKTATVFKDNTQLFGKVFFPRLVVPLSIIVSSLLKFAIQFLFFIILVLFNSQKEVSSIHLNSSILLVPFLIILMAGMALGSGLIIASLTTKYKDLTFLISFGVQLLMYASPIIYSTSTIESTYVNYIKLNPLCGIIESFRTAFLGVNTIDFYSLLYSFLCMIFLLVIGVMMFNKVEQKFIDTV